MGRINATVRIKNVLEKEMEHKLTIKLGAFIAAGVTLLAALIKFF